MARRRNQSHRSLLSTQSERCCSRIINPNGQSSFILSRDFQGQAPSIFPKTCPTWTKFKSQSPWSSSTLIKLNTLMKSKVFYQKSAPIHPIQSWTLKSRWADLDVPDYRLLMIVSHHRRKKRLIGWYRKRDIHVSAVDTLDPRYRESVDRKRSHGRGWLMKTKHRHQKSPP